MRTRPASAARPASINPDSTTAPCDRRDERPARSTAIRESATTGRRARPRAKPPTLGGAGQDQDEAAILVGREAPTIASRRGDVEGNIHGPAVLPCHERLGQGGGP